MTCSFRSKLMKTDSFIEQYMEGSLSPENLYAFEEHLLTCEHCLRKVEVWHALRILAARPAADSDPDVARSEIPAKKKGGDETTSGEEK